MTFEVTVLGTSSAIPAHQRHPSSQFLLHQNTGILIDCGEGTQMQLQRYGLKRSKIEHIFISHLHGDHYFGLIGLLTTLNLLRHPKPLHLYAHAPLAGILKQQMEAGQFQLALDFHFHPIPTAEPSVLFQSAHLRVTSLPLEHRIPCAGFVFEEMPRERTYLPQTGAQYQVPVEKIPDIKKGEDFITPDGERIPNNLLTKPPAPPRKFVYFTDTRPLSQWDAWLKGANLLYHESTFAAQQEERAVKTYHTTSAQAAQIASRNRVKQLLLGHFSAKYSHLDHIAAEAQAIFPNSIVAVEGCTYLIE